MSRAGPQQAYVLHQWDWSETSLILDLFTRHQGRLAVVAKGAKRPYSQLRPVLLPFQCLLVQTVRAKGEDAAEIVTLRSAEYAGGGTVLAPSRLMAGFYLNELLLKLLARNDPHERLFEAYAQALAALAVGDDEAALRAGNDEAALRAFELQLLRECGVLPELDRGTVSQTPVAADRRYRLQAEAGLVVAPDDDVAALSGALCRRLQAALDAHDSKALREATRSALPALRVQLRALLHYHLGSPPLRTRQLMLDVRRLLERAPPTAAAPQLPSP